LVRCGTVVARVVDCGSESVDVCLVRCGTVVASFNETRLMRLSDGEAWLGAWMGSELAICWRDCHACQVWPLKTNVLAHAVRSLLNLEALASCPLWTSACLPHGRNPKAPLALCQPAACIWPHNARCLERLLAVPSDGLHWQGPAYSPLLLSF